MSIVCSGSRHAHRDPFSARAVRPSSFGTDYHQCNCNRRSFGERPPIKIVHRIIAQVHDEYTQTPFPNEFGKFEHGILETAPVFLEPCLVSRLRGTVPEILNTRIIRRD